MRRCYRVRQLGRLRDLLDASDRLDTAIGEEDEPVHEVVLEGSTHDNERARVAAVIAQDQDGSEVVGQMPRPSGVVRVLHVLDLAVDTDRLQPFEAVKHSFSVGG
jgi:hypothetical protein